MGKGLRRGVGPAAHAIGGQACREGKEEELLGHKCARTLFCQEAAQLRGLEEQRAEEAPHAQQQDEEHAHPVEHIEEELFVFVADVCAGLVQRHRAAQRLSLAQPAAGKAIGGCNRRGRIKGTKGIP